MYANMPRIAAKRMIREGKYDPTDYKAVYELFLSAYGNESFARQQRLEAMVRYTRKSCEQSKNRDRK
jgi:hypothetical protein